MSEGQYLTLLQVIADLQVGVDALGLDVERIERRTAKMAEVLELEGGTETSEDIDPPPWVNGG